MATAFGTTVKWVYEYVPVQRPQKVSVMLKFPLSAHNHIIRINARLLLFIYCKMCDSFIPLIWLVENNITAQGCLTVLVYTCTLKTHLIPALPHTVVTQNCCVWGWGSVTTFHLASDGPAQMFWLWVVKYGWYYTGNMWEVLVSESEGMLPVPAHTEHW